MATRCVNTFRFRRLILWLLLVADVSKESGLDLKRLFVQKPEMNTVLRSGTGLLMPLAMLG